VDDNSYSRQGRSHAQGRIAVTTWSGAVGFQAPTQELQHGGFVGAQGRVGLRDRFERFDNVLVELPGSQQSVSTPITVTLPTGTQRYTFTLRRAATNQATTLHLTAVDTCGLWRTFVGGGAGAF